MHKRHIINDYIAEMKPELFFIAEANVDSTMNLDLLNVTNYTIYTSGTIKDNYKARILVLAKDGWKLISQFMSDTDELIIMEKNDLTVIGIYRPFKKLKNETARGNLERLLNKIQNYTDQNINRKIIITGDFNVDYNRIGDKRYQCYHLANMIMDFQVKNNLEQKIKGLTRHRLINKDGNQFLQTSLLDHVYSNSLIIEDTITHPTIASDHDIIQIKIIGKTKTTTEIKYVRDWRKYTGEKLKQEVIKSDWNLITNTSDLTTLNDRIEQSLRTAYDKIVPWRRLRTRNSDYRS